MNRTVYEAKGEQLITQIGMSKAEFARRVGIQRQNVKSLFRSHNLETIQKVSHVLNVPVDYLISYVDPVNFNEYPFDSFEQNIQTADSQSPLLFEVSPEDVPTGDSTEDRRARQQIIRNFYKQWLLSHSEPCIYNKSIRDNICVQYISVHETAGQASLKYLSTLAVLQLDAILSNAVVNGESKPKRMTKSQQPFVKMITMTCSLPGIGRVKMIVGVKRADGSKVQYCVTAVTPEK